MRAAILVAAGQIASAQGVQTLTIQAVAAAAGVTKGGLLHHFPDKDSLIHALRDLAVAAFEAELERMMAADPQPEGRFTRAYIRSCLDPETALGGTGALITALWADPAMRHDWYHWMAGLEARHAATDGATRLRLLRYAADGVWMAMTDGQDGLALLPVLLAATHERAE